MVDIVEGNFARLRVDLMRVIGEFIFDELETERICPLHFENEVGNAVDQSRFTGTSSSQQQDRFLLLLPVRIGCPENEAINNVARLGTFCYWKGVNVQVVPIANLLTTCQHRLTEADLFGFRCGELDNFAGRTFLLTVFQHNHNFDAVRRLR